MDIAALSTAMSQMNASTQISASLIKMQLDMAEQTSSIMNHMIEETAVHPTSGGNLDIRL